MFIAICKQQYALRAPAQCTKRLDETQWPETRDETYWAKTETYCFETETRRQYVSRPRRLDRDHIPGNNCNYVLCKPNPNKKLSCR